MMAEALKIGKEEIQEHITCSMCKNTFTNPQELACFHVFCERCLKTLPRVESENKLGFHCPTCNTFCVLGEEKTPYMRNEFVKAFTSGERRCGTCGKDGAVWYCQECDYILCDDCKVYHSKMLLSKGHTVVSREKEDLQKFVINKKIVCEVHADEVVQHYCTVCQELVCSNCLAEKHVHKQNDVRKLVDAADILIPVIAKKVTAIEGKNKIHEDHVASSESQMNDVREVFDGVRVELDEVRQIVLQKINSQYDRDVKLLQECKNKEIMKLTEFKEKNEYDIAENNRLVSFTKVTLQSAKSGSLMKELTQGLSRRIDYAVSKKPLDNSKKIKLPRVEKNVCILADEHILGKINWDLNAKTITAKDHKPRGKNNISCLAITILVVIIAVVAVYALQGAYLNQYPCQLNRLHANPDSRNPDIKSANRPHASADTEKQHIELGNRPQGNPDIDKPDIETANKPHGNPDTDKPDIETANKPHGNPDTDKPDIETENRPQGNPDTDNPDIETLDKSLPQDNNKEFEPSHTVQEKLKNSMDLETPTSQVENWNAVEHRINNSIKNIDSDFRHVSQNISEVLDRLSPAGRDIYTLPSDAERMALVNDTIWIPLTDTHSKAVITLNGTVLNMIHFPGYTSIRPRSVLQVNTSDVLLASEVGLYVVNSTGQIQYKVAEGDFHDISKHEDNVIALQWVSDEEIRLHSLKYDSIKWICDKATITINNSFESFEMTMAVYGEFVYICSRYNDKIYKFTLGGVLLQTYGEPGSSVGRLLFPRLCAIDPWGTVLICDWGDDRLQTLSSEGEWREYKLGSGTRWSLDAIIVDKSLYVLWYESGNENYRIIQYTIGD